MGRLDRAYHRLLVGDVGEMDHEKLGGPSVPGGEKHGRCGDETEHR